MIGIGVYLLPIYRFYFDGLIVHYHRHESDNGETAKLGNIIVGAQRELVVTTIEYRYSFQAENIAKIFSAYSDFIYTKNHNA